MTLVTPTTATIATATATTPTATNSAPNDSLILETTKGAACRSQLLQISQTPCSHNQGVPFLSPNPPSPTTLKSHFKASARKLGRFFGEQEDAIPMDISLISSAATSTATGHSSLESLLNSRIPLAYLLYTCIKEHSSENLFFILEVDHFKSLIRSNISSSSQPSTLVPSIAVAAESSSSPSSSHSHSSTLLVEGWTAAKHICNTYLNPSSQFEINIPNKLRISIIDAVKAYRRYNCHPKTSPSRSRSRSSNTGVNGGRDGCGGTRNVSPPPPPPSTLDDIEFLLLDLSSVFDEARKHIMKLLEASHVSFLKSREYKDMLDSLLVSSNNTSPSSASSASSSSSSSTSKPPQSSLQLPYDTTALSARQSAINLLLSLLSSIHTPKPSKMIKEEDVEFYKQLKSKRKRSLLIRHMVVEFIHSILGVDLREVVLMEKEAGREEGWGGGAVGVGGEQEAGHQDNSLPPEK